MGRSYPRAGRCDSGSCGYRPSRSHSDRRTAMTDHRIGSREEWLVDREALLRREKQHTRMGDELARERRELPWVRLEKEYRFEADDGTRTMAELFDGRSQLLVYHFMFGPGYEAGCPVCSSSADAVNGVLPHLHARDVTMVYVSRAPLAKLQAYKRRMGWSCLFDGGPAVKRVVLFVGCSRRGGAGGLFLFRRLVRRLFVGAASASQFHAGPSGGQKAAGACRDVGGPARLRAGGLERLLAAEDVPAGDQDLARDGGLGRVLAVRLAMSL